MAGDSIDEVVETVARLNRPNARGRRKVVNPRDRRSDDRFAGPSP